MPLHWRLPVPGRPAVLVVRSLASYEGLGFRGARSNLDLNAAGVQAEQEAPWRGSAVSGTTLLFVSSFLA